jgi:hypothetical protein
MVKQKLHYTAGIVVMTTLASIGTLFQWDVLLVRLVPGLILTWFVPGYALMFALFPFEIEPIERTVLSVVASFVLAILTGVLMDHLPSGLNSGSAVLMLWGMTMVLLAVGHIRLAYAERRRPQDDQANQDAAGPTEQTLSASISASGLRTDAPNVQREKPSLKYASGAVIAIALVLASGVWAVSSIFAAVQPDPKPFTALAVEHDPLNTSPDQLRIVLGNHEGLPMRYHLTLQTQEQVIAQWNDVLVDNNAQWVAPLPLLDAHTAADLLVYRAGENQIYRRITVRGIP